MLQIHCLDDESARHFAYVGAEPDISEPSERTIDVVIEKLHGGYYDFAPPFDGKPGVKSHLLNRVHQILRDLMIEETAGCPVLHGASIVCNNRRFLIVASKGSGKTTLSLKCVAEGLNVEGDEHVAIRQIDILARPRKLRIKKGSLVHVTEFAEKIACCPSITDWEGNLIYSMAPETDRQCWRINAGSADFLLFLTQNHGGLTSIRRLPDVEAFTRLLEQTFLPASGKPAALARLHNLVRQTSCWELRLGSLSQAVWHLRQLSHS